MLCVAFPSGVFDNVAIRQNAGKAWKFAQLLKDWCQYLFRMYGEKNERKKNFYGTTHCWRGKFAAHVFFASALILYCSLVTTGLRTDNATWCGHQLLCSELGCSMAHLCGT